MLNKSHIGLLILLAPCLFLWTQVLLPGASHLIGSLSTTKALPSYYLRLSDGQLASQSDADTVVHLNQDAALRVLIQPDEHVAGETSVAAFLIQGGHVVPWPIGLRRAASGAFSMSAPIRATPGLSVGQWDVLFVVGRPQMMPDSPLNALNDALTDQRDTRLLWGRINIAASKL